MDTVVLEVADRATVNARIIRACQNGKPEKEAHISFETSDLMWRTITAKRWDILKAMAGAGVLGVRELARRLNRDVRAVHSDTRVLLNAGVIDKTDDGKLLFPYRRVKMQLAFDAPVAMAA